MNYSTFLPVCIAFLLISSIAVLSAYAATTTNDITKIALVGDISGTSIRDLIKEHNPDLVVVLGDVGYKSTLDTFKKDYGIFNLKCLVGNHDSREDAGGDPIVKEAQAYCGDWWNVKVGSTTMLFGFNTNGDLNNQLEAAKKKSLQGIKTLIVMTHKPCYTTPNSYHPVEPNVKAFCDSLASSIPAGIKVYYIAAHNHQLASTIDGTKFLSGGGGRSHYECGTDAVWNFCDNKNFGFLEVAINANNGDIVANFVK
ncbi:MAG: metallophosphoesterase [Nitrososphaeraceae archaeon]